MKSKVFWLVLLFFFFLTAGIVSAYLSFKPESPQAIANSVAAKLTLELEKVDAASKRILAQDNTELSQQDAGEYSFFLFNHQDLVFWTDNSFVPFVQSVTDTFRLKLTRSGSSDYLLKKWVISPDKYLVAVIPLYRQYSISNEYLSPEWNNRIFPINNITIHEPGSATGFPVCVAGKCPFKIDIPSQGFFHQGNASIAAVVLLSVSVVLILLFVYNRIEKIKRWNAETGFVILYLTFMALRTLMTRLNFPHALIRSKFFDPKVFASSSLNASLGDLILNELAVLALCYYIFKNYPSFKMIRLANGNNLVSWVFSIFAGLCFWFAALFPFVVVQTLYTNSSISLDISQSIQFDSLRLGVLLAVMLSGACTFLFSHAFVRMLISCRQNGKIFISLFLSAVIFSLVNESTGQKYFISLLVGIIYFLLVYWLHLYRSLNRLSYTTFVYLFVTIFYLAANVTYGVNYWGKKEKIDSQFRFANNFLIDRDYFAEYLLSEVSQRISGDVFIQTRLASSYLGRETIRQKIRQLFIPSYFNKYDVEIFLFTSSGSSLDNRSAASFSETIELYNSETFKTDYPSVYSVDSPTEDVTQKYLVVVPVVKSGAIAGYVVVELALKKIIPESVYPELLVDNRFRQFYKTQDMSYAVFSKNEILFSAGEFNYEHLFDHDWLGNQELYISGLQKSGYDHIAQEDDNQKVVVVSTLSHSWIFNVANFSFFLVLGLTVILLFILIQGLLNYARGNKFFFAARIQLFLNFAFFLPLIVVSITTLSLTSRSSQQQLEEEFLSKAREVSDEMSVYLDQYLQGSDEDQISMGDHLNDLAKFSDLDANVYDAHGKLLATSQPLIFENNLLSIYSSPGVMEKIRDGDNFFINTESVGKLKYFVAYAALKSPLDGKLTGVLGIPFFQSAYSQEKVLIRILANILNIFAGFFVVLLLLSWFVADWLTFPLKFITQSLRKTSLTKINQPLVWKADDEIGLMVKEYNQMLFKLSESKVELERTQRERAWREMAQQVAHEIKNPLTPMKLTLQQLERSVSSETNSTEKTQKALTSLLEQVDTLSDIASSFSSFAKMPEPVIQKLELISLLKRVVNLHGQSGEIHFKSTFKALYVRGDEPLLGRIFSNVILNAFQAARPGVPVQLWIDVEKSVEHCKISFRDNGKGIAKEFVERIFIPHFSTKKSGSGLGLAISKQGLEQMGGRIWFDSKPGQGAVFHIELPLE